jgi:hypothetical protein
VDVNFTPPSLGLKAGAVTISSNDPDDPEMLIFVSGSGVTEVAIQLLHFSAEYHQGQVLLTWKIAGEEGLTGYRLLRKCPDALAYARIGDIEMNTGLDSYTYIDRPERDTGQYLYQLVALNDRGEAITVGRTSVSVDASVPQETTLSQNYPNPFNPETTIHYGIGRKGWVDITVYNMLGQRVKTLVAHYHQPGYYSAIWRGDDGRGEPVNSGIYVARLVAGEHVACTKMLLLK